jgi:hypothetical protein
MVRPNAGQTGKQHQQGGIMNHHEARPISNAIPAHLIQALAPKSDSVITPRGLYDAEDPIGLQQIASAALCIWDHLADKKPVHASETWIRAYGPYTFVTLCSGLILPINREYKPIGLSSVSTHVNYENYTCQAIPPDRLDFQWVWHGYPVRLDGNHRFYLYSDINAPYASKNYLREYFVRLLGIIKKTTEPGVATP